MFLRALGRIRSACICIFAIIGVAGVVFGGSGYLRWRFTEPTYVGNVHDCRQPNLAAVMEVSQLMSRPEYAPSVEVSHYPDDKATMLSLNTAVRNVHLVFSQTTVVLRVVRGKVPAAKKSESLMAQR